MKKYKIYTVAFICCLASCENFTDVDAPQSLLAGQTVYDQVETCEAVLADIYASMRDNGMVCGTNSGLSSLMGNYSDELTFYGTNTEGLAFYNHTVAASNTMVSGLWVNTYSQLYTVNALLSGVQGSELISGENRNRLLGEAYFIRAYLHFYLLNVFGDIPYVTTTDYKENAVISKTSAAQVWELLINDLVTAEGLLPTDYPSAERVRPNKAVATAMLARAFLYTGEWEMAASYAGNVINNPDYIWENDLDAVFLKDSPSIIWCLHAGMGGLNTNDAMTFIFAEGPPVVPALSENLYNAFEPGDQRREHWIRAITDGTDVWYHAYKYKEYSSTPTSQEYTILLRMAEQYLIRSEARAHLGDITGARQDLNIVRNRAGLVNTTADDLPSLKEAIASERRVELFAEQGHRWFDLKRTGMAAAVLEPVKPSWHNTDILLPIPQSELLLNGNLSPQNPGY